MTMPATFDVVTTVGRLRADDVAAGAAPRRRAVDAWADRLLGDVGGLTATVTMDGRTTAVSLADAGVTTATMRAAAAGGSGVLNTLAEHAGGGTAEPSPELAAALDAAAALQRLLRGARPLTDDDVGGERAAVASLSTPSSQTEWLHDVAHVRPIVDALARLDLSERVAGRRLGLRFIATAPRCRHRFDRSAARRPADRAVARQLERGDAGDDDHDRRRHPLRRAALASASVDPPRHPAEPGRGLVDRRRRGRGERDRRPRPDAHGAPRRGLWRAAPGDLPRRQHLGRRCVDGLRPTLA